MSAHTWASRLAVGLTVSLALLQLWWAGVGTAGPAPMGTATVLGPLTLLAAVLLARSSCFETRFVVAVACLAQLALMLLGVVAGLPGQPREQVDQHALEALLLPAAALVLLVLDRRARRSSSPTPEVLSPYAR